MSSPATQALANPLFRGYLQAGVISAVGDQLTLIALPWLALALSADVRVVATVLALVALPRAVFLLLGGALADRFDAKRLLVLTRSASGLALLVLCALLGWGSVGVGTLMAFALLLGTLGAVGMPAASSMVPRLLPKEQAQLGNTLVMSLGQIVALAGPLLAGLVLAGGRPVDGLGVPSGFLWAFGADAATFLVSALLLMRLSVPRLGESVGTVAAGMREGWTHLRSDRTLSTVLLYLLIVNLFIAGPVSVGLPILVKQTLQGTALQYGTFLTLMGVGGLVGMVLSAKLRLKEAHLLIKLAALDILVGLLLALFVHLPAVWLMTVVLLLVGAIGGYVQANVLQALQSRTPPALMGRVMSFLLFSYVGLVPLSAAVAGMLTQRLGMATMLEGAGVGAALAALVLALLTRQRPAAAQATQAEAKPEAARI